MREVRDRPVARAVQRLDSGAARRRAELEDEGDGEGRAEPVYQGYGGEAAEGGGGEDRRCPGASAVYLSEE